MKRTGADYFSYIVALLIGLMFGLAIAVTGPEPAEPPDPYAPTVTSHVPLAGW